MELGTKPLQDIDPDTLNKMLDRIDISQLRADAPYISFINNLFAKWCRYNKIDSVVLVNAFKELMLTGQIVVNPSSITIDKRASTIADNATLKAMRNGSIPSPLLCNSYNTVLDKRRDSYLQMLYLSYLSDTQRHISNAKKKDLRRKWEKREKIYQKILQNREKLKT